MNAPLNSLEIAIPEEFQSCFDRQRAAHLAATQPSHAERVADLRSLSRMLKEAFDKAAAT